jgi:hypothetical protein
MSQPTTSRWVRLQQDGDQFVGDLWPGSDEQQRHEILVSVLWSGKVPLRACMIAKPHWADGRPAHPLWERLGYPRGSVPVPHVEKILLNADPRTIDVDIPAGRIVISAFIAHDNDAFWAAFFPGWLTNAAGRFIVIEMDNIDFDRAAARDYVVENLLPANVTPSDTLASTAELLESAKPQAPEQIARATAAETASVEPELPASKSTPPPLYGVALDDALDKWALLRWGEDLNKLPSRDELLSLARTQPGFSKVSQKDIRALRRRLAPDEIKRGGGKMHRRS